MKIAILGFAREGRSLKRFLKKVKKFKKSDIEILDRKFDKNYLQRLTQFDLIFRSPGVPYNLLEIQKAIKNGIKFSSATQLFFELCPAKVIGITGTKGKGTTATLLYKILKSCGLPVYLAGNIGKPAIDILPKLTKKSWVILELSSFQLQDLKKTPAHPKIAVILDIFPDHLDAHKNLKEYFKAKSNLAIHQEKSDAIFYFKNNPQSRKIAAKSNGRKIGIAGESFGLKKNYVMAAAVAAYLGCPTNKITKTIRGFQGLKHRLELVREVKIKHGIRVRFYNDSAATNPTTTAAAIEHFHSQPLILIAGGKDKNLDYTPMMKAIKQSKNLKSVILFGENKNKIKKGIKKLRNLEIKTCDNLNSAIKIAHQKIKSSVIHHSSLAIVLFSPASASFDLFKDYADRGKQFTKIVKNIKI